MGLGLPYGFINPYINSLNLYGGLYNYNRFYGGGIYNPLINPILPISPVAPVVAPLIPPILPVVPPVTPVVPVVWWNILCLSFYYKIFYIFIFY